MIIPSIPLRAMEKDGKAAKGSFGDGEATIPLLKAILWAGLSMDICVISPRGSFFGNRGDQRDPSLFPNIMGGAGDFSASATSIEDADEISLSSSNETDCQNAWLRRELSGDSASRLRGAGFVIINRGDSLTGLRKFCFRGEDT